MAETKDKRVEVKTKTPPATAKILPTTEPPEEIYVDGVMAITLRHGVAKIECYRVAGRAAADDPTELRRHSHRLVLPAAGLGDLMQILEQTKSAIVAAVERARTPKPGEGLQ
jgi:hypothetical protein